MDWLGLAGHSLASLGLNWMAWLALVCLGLNYLYLYKIIWIGFDGIGFDCIGWIGFWLCLFDTNDIVLPFSEDIGWDDLGLDSLGNINPRSV
jgi:hypothetical protein